MCIIMSNIQNGHQYFPPPQGMRALWRIASFMFQGKEGTTWDRISHQQARMLLQVPGVVEISRSPAKGILQR